MNPIPALSVRQPWAWLIIYGGKDVENRTWPTYYRGPLLIHAAKGMTMREYRECQAFTARLGITLPHAQDLVRSGIVGQVRLLDCVRYHRSPWFTGPYGWVLADAQPLPFQACAGCRGLFNPFPLEAAQD